MITTTYWQSLELLRVGLDRETSDFYYVDTPSGKKDLRWRGSDVVFPLTASEIPSWSLSALWDFIHNIDKTYDFDTGMPARELMQALVDTIIRRLKPQE